VVLGHISPWLRGTLTIFARIAVKVPILEWRSWPYWALFTMYTTYPSRPCLSLGLKSTYRMGKSKIEFQISLSLKLVKKNSVLDWTLR